MRLLVCDDHRLLLDALSMALSDRGHTVVATADHTLDEDPVADFELCHSTTVPPIPDRVSPDRRP